MKGNNIRRALDAAPGAVPPGSGACLSYTHVWADPAFWHLLPTLKTLV